MTHVNKLVVNHALSQTLIGVFAWKLAVSAQMLLQMIFRILYQLDLKQPFGSMMTYTNAQVTKIMLIIQLQKWATECLEVVLDVYF